MRAIDRMLAEIEPDTPPSLRYNRLLSVAGAEILELRDPNSGQSGGPATKPRHQYVVAGDRLWRRVLPMLDPALTEMQQEFVDREVPWEQYPAATPASDLLRTFLECARTAGLAVLEPDADDAGAIPMGPVLDAWWTVPLPPCPDCGGDVVWWEAGYVPGTRKCVGCDSLFSVRVRRAR